MNSVLRTARTVEEAVQQALEELGCTREEVNVEVLEEPKGGLFGFLGSKDAVVRVERKEEAVVEKIPSPDIAEPVGKAAPVILEEESGEVSKAEALLQTILKGMEIDAQVSATFEDSALEVEILGADERDTGIVIGRRGETLDAIQYLLNLAQNRGHEGYTRVTLDINGYRKKREESLVRLAMKTADKAKKYRRNMRFEPMNPYERRIIHSALQKVVGITTASEGDEPYRRVVIRVNRK
ncbi:MAG: RNA-binding cell elongation regulator Jag/EloR [Tissierellia bacterium]|nr:RNA-binding cell elongation regulator Jag/EloR [Tissierellia bacterium]